jgi:ABC-type phosphate transport system ATPase subunit
MEARIWTSSMTISGTTVSLDIEEHRVTALIDHPAAAIDVLRTLNRMNETIPEHAEKGLSNSTVDIIGTSGMYRRREIRRHGLPEIESFPKSIFDNARTVYEPTASKTGR